MMGNFRVVYAFRFENSTTIRFDLIMDRETF